MTESLSDEDRARLDIARPDLTLLVLLRDQVQKLRIAEGNRAEAARKLGEVNRVELHGRYLDRLEQLEKEVTTDVVHEMERHPAWPWLKDIHGVGPTSAALVVGYIDIEKAPTVSALWRFAGYAVIDGQRERLVKGEKAHYNRRLKTMVWRLIDLQVKSRGPYRAIYDGAKHGYITTRMEPEAARKALAKKAAVEVEQLEDSERAATKEQPVQIERVEEQKQSDGDERAAILEQPVPYERVAIVEQSDMGERAGANEQLAEHERAVLGEKPDEVERAERLNQLAGVERAEVGKQPTESERAVLPEQPVGNERTYWTLGHCEAAARRKAAKVFLSHLWQVWREAEGLTVTAPYIVGKGEHDIIDPWSMVGAVTLKQPSTSEPQ